MSTSPTVSSLPPVRSGDSFTPNQHHDEAGDDRDGRNEQQHLHRQHVGERARRERAGDRAELERGHEQAGGLAGHRRRARSAERLRDQTSAISSGSQTT